MKEIDLRDLFPEYELDCSVEVPDENAEAFIASMTKEAAAIYFEAEREESSSRRRKYRHKAHYSLDAGDGIARAESVDEKAVRVAIDRGLQELENFLKS